MLSARNPPSLRGKNLDLADAWVRARIGCGGAESPPPPRRCCSSQAQTKPTLTTTPMMLLTLKLIINSMKDITTLLLVMLSSSNLSPAALTHQIHRAVLKHITTKKPFNMPKLITTPMMLIPSNLSPCQSLSIQ